MQEDEGLAERAREAAGAGEGGNRGVELCDFFEQLEKQGTDAMLPAVSERRAGRVGTGGVIEQSGCSTFERWAGGTLGVSGGDLVRGVFGRGISLGVMGGEKRVGGERVTLFVL